MNEIKEREIEMPARMQRRSTERHLDQICRVKTCRAFDLIQPEVVRAQWRTSSVVTARIVKRNIGFELPGPGEDICLVETVFDDPAQLRGVGTPAAAPPHRRPSRSVGPQKRNCAGRCNFHDLSAGTLEAAHSPPAAGPVWL